MTATPVLSPITRHNGVAGQYAYAVTVTYPGETPERVSFVSSAWGGPIVMVTRSRQTVVADPQRFGATLTLSWVRAFFA